MKHAYLIIAHNEPKILQLLVSALDDKRNDIYIHIDKKTDFSWQEFLSVSESNLNILPYHLDIRWGDYSMVEAEYLLFETAFLNGPYAYYHLLSGVDLPIKSQDFIHEYCKLHKGKEFIGIAQNVTQRELIWRSQHYFLFSNDFRTKNIFKKAIRALFARLQSLIYYRRSFLDIKKGAQWCSLTNEFVGYLLENKNLVSRIFNHTYCPDELFIQTLCWNSVFKNHIYNLNDEFNGCKRYIKWENGELKPLTVKDIKNMIQSPMWFARKFSLDNMEVIQEILKNIK